MINKDLVLLFDLLNELSDKSITKFKIFLFNKDTELKIIKAFEDSKNSAT